MSLPKPIIQRDPGLLQWNILTCYRGSIAHGMYVAPEEPTGIDDKDVLAVCIPDPEYYWGLREYGSRGTKEIKQDEWDIVIYEFKKFIHLLIQGNPNVLYTLWLEPKNYIHIITAGELLINNRDLFVGKHVYRSFAGYAYSQLHKMTHMAFEGYMGEKRRKLVQQFGFDTKNGAHCIRLLRMVIEFLKEGKLYVERFDAPQLLEIKRGEWPLEKVQKLAEDLLKKTEQAYMDSSLPSELDINKINQLCIDAFRIEWARRNIDLSFSQKVL